jgi:hypothetical protein
MWDETPTSWQLRMAFPREAKALEDIMISEKLQSLGLVTTKLGSSKASNFRIKLEDQYELLISPVDKGADGYSEWFTWNAPVPTQQNNEFENTMPESSIRAHIQLYYSDETGRSQIYSFTHHHQNVETLIRTALKGIHHDLGLKLKPITRKRKGKRN